MGEQREGPPSAAVLTPQQSMHSSGQHKQAAGSRILPMPAWLAVGGTSRQLGLEVQSHLPHTLLLTWHMRTRSS